MSSINLLHASDLHIAVDACLRSPIDRWSDLEKRWDLSFGGIKATTKALRDSIKALIKKGASSYHPDILELLTEFIVENSNHIPAAGAAPSIPKLDAVVLTGDLATTGRKSDIDEVKKFFTANPNPKLPYKSNEPHYKGATLAAVSIPKIFLPGNHDRFRPTYRLYGGVPIYFAPNEVHFDGLGIDYRANPVKIETLPQPKGATGLAVTILAADFTLHKLGDHQGRFGWLAQGKATGGTHQPILDRLIAETRQAKLQKQKDEVLCVLWCIHFPPSFPGIENTNRLLGEADVLKAAHDEGVDGILAGHTHEQLTYSRPTSKCPVYCCGTTTQYEPRSMPGGPDEHNLQKGNFFQILSITSDHGVARITVHHFRLFGVRDGSGEILWEWKRVPP
jgi:3',5'-cyclic AMP phosphodiesterase CpdA